MSSEKVEVKLKLTEDERKCLRDLCRRAFADRLSDDQRRMLVEAFAFGQMFIVCATCGNKRCPRATDHRLACVDEGAGFLADAECDRLGKLLTDAVRELDSAPCQHCGAPLSTPGHRMVTRDPRIDRDEPLDGKVRLWLTCEVGGKAGR